jgi:diguanylate cyclase (GGDEF)-like protein/PAS domain S-box-containing protein
MFNSTDMERLLMSIEETYKQFEADDNTLEHVLELTAQKLDEDNSGMRAVHEGLVDRNPLGIFAFDRECRYILWNPAMKRFTNMSDQQTLGKCAFDVFPDLKKEGLDLLFYKALSGTTTPPFEHDYPYLDTGERAYPNVDMGDQGYCEGYLTPLFSENGTIIGGLGVLRDICEFKRVKMTIQRQLEYLQILQEMAFRLSDKEELEGFFEDMLRHICQIMETPHAFMSLIEASSSQFVNRFVTGIFKDITGLGFMYNEKLVKRIQDQREPIIINNYQYLVDRELDQLSSWIAVPLFQENTIVGVIGVAYTESGKSVGEVDATLLKQIAQLASIGLVHEALHEANARLATLATIDPLTNLPNHRTVISHIEEMLAHSHNTQEECAILFLDIDHFKSINDTWGHQAGDEVLREVGRRLKSNVRKEDVVGRYGGEEFAVVLPAIDLELATQTAERLRQALSITPCFWKAELGEPALAIPLTASIGVAMYRSHGMTREELIEAADLAMYQAKHKGRNQVRIAGIEENHSQMDLAQHLDKMTSASGSVLSALTAMANAHDRGTSKDTYRTASLAKAANAFLQVLNEQRIIEASPVGDASTGISDAY